MKDKWIITNYCPDCNDEGPIEFLKEKTGEWYFRCQKCAEEFFNDTLSKRLLKEKNIHITSDYQSCWCDYSHENPEIEP